MEDFLQILWSSLGTLGKESCRNEVQHMALNPTKTSWIYHCIHNPDYTFVLSPLN